MLVKQSHSKCMLSGTQVDTEHTCTCFISLFLAGWLEWFCVDFLLTCYVGTEEWSSRWLESCGQHYCSGITAGQSGCITMTSCQKHGFTSQWLLSQTWLYITMTSCQKDDFTSQWLPVKNMALHHNDFLSETWLYVTVTSCQKQALHHSDFLSEIWLYITMTSCQKRGFISQWLLVRNMALRHSDCLSETWLYIRMTSSRQKHIWVTSEWLPQNRNMALHQNDFF